MRCNTTQFKIARLFKERSAINTEPVYQRQAGVWMPKDNSLFLHSLFKGYDIPKLYLHKLPRGEKCSYALVDGKQRLQCIWGFLDGSIPLGAHDHTPTDKVMAKETPFPKKGDCFDNLSSC